jgi:hypothetical protein
MDTIDTCRFVSELLYTDTRVWEVVKRTAATMTLRSTLRTDDTAPVEGMDPGAYGLRVMRTRVEPNPAGETIVVRRRKDGGFAIGSNRRLRAINGTPYEVTDYRY